MALCARPSTAPVLRRARRGKEKLDSFVERYLDAHARATDRTFELAGTAWPGLSRRTQARPIGQAPARPLRRGEGGWCASSSIPRARTRSARDGSGLAMLFIVTYRELPLLAWPREVLDSLVEMEQLFVIFRQRHARMVERIDRTPHGHGRERGRGLPGPDRPRSTASSRTCGPRARSRSSAQRLRSWRIRGSTGSGAADARGAESGQLPPLSHFPRNGQQQNTDEGVRKRRELSWLRTSWLPHRSFRRSTSFSDQS